MHMQWFGKEQMEPPLQCKITDTQRKSIATACKCIILHITALTSCILTVSRVLSSVSSAAWLALAMALRVGELGQDEDLEGDPGTGGPGEADWDWEGGVTIRLMICCWSPWDTVYCCDMEEGRPSTRSALTLVTEEATEEAAVTAGRFLGGSGGAGSSGSLVRSLEEWNLILRFRLQLGRESICSLERDLERLSVLWALLLSVRCKNPPKWRTWICCWRCPEDIPWKNLPAPGGTEGDNREWTVTKTAKQVAEQFLAAVVEDLHFSLVEFTTKSEQQGAKFCPQWTYQVNPAALGWGRGVQPGVGQLGVGQLTVSLVASSFSLSSS